MKPKTKIILSAISLVLVFTLGIVGVFALTQINTDAKLRVKFIAQKNVYASISAKSYKSSQEAPVESLSPLVIDGSEEDGYEGSLAFSNLIEVTQAETVDYVFEITNTTEVVTNSELIIEPIIEFADDFATWTIYYMADKEVGYKQLSNLNGTGDTYTYISLAKGESVRVRLSLRSTNSEEDVFLDDSSMSFRLYTESTVPDDYLSDSVKITKSNLKFYGVGDLVTLENSLVPYAYLFEDFEYNEKIKSEWINYLDGKESIFVDTGKMYDGEIILKNTEDGEYYWNRYGFADTNELIDIVLMKPVKFVVVELDENAITLISQEVVGRCVFENYKNYENAELDAPKQVYNNLAELLGVEDIALLTTIENYDAEGNVINTSSVKLWAPHSSEIEKWKNANIRNFNASAKANNFFSGEFLYFIQYLLRDAGVIEDGKTLYRCVDEYGNYTIPEVMYVDSNTKYYMDLGIRPVMKISQPNYKGF